MEKNIFFYNVVLYVQGYVLDAESEVCS